MQPPVVVVSVEEENYYYTNGLCWVKTPLCTVVSNKIIPSLKFNVMTLCILEVGLLTHIKGAKVAGQFTL